MTPQPEPVAWDVAERVAGRVARRTDTRIDWATLRSLVIDFEEVTAQAEALVEESTGLRSLVGPARAQVATREEWIHANVSSFRRLLGPVLARAGKSGPGLSGLLGPVGRVAAGAEMGVVLGWMSGRVSSASTTCCSQTATHPRTPFTTWGRTSSPWSAGTGSNPGSSGSGSRCTS